MMLKPWRPAAVALLVALLPGASFQDAPQEPGVGSGFDVEGARAAVREALAKDREAALARVKEAQGAIAADLKEEGEREGRIGQALKELTAREPLKVTLSQNVLLEGVRVTSYVAGRVKLTWPQGEVEYPLGALPEETRATLIGGILGKATPRDQFEIGKLLVQGKDYVRAARCFALAGQRDPALAALAPDLEKVKRASRLFEGEFKAAGSTLGLRWTFGKADEARDFHALKGTLAARPGQGLLLESPNTALAAVREIPFRDRVRVSALAREGEGTAHLLGLRFVKPNGGEVLIYGAVATWAKQFLVIRVEDDEAREVLAPTPGAAGNRMTMDFNRGRFVFQVGDKTVWQGNEGGFTDVSVILGGVALGKTGKGASAVFREVTLSGGVNPLWMEKKTAGYRDALAAELSKEHRAGRGEGSVGSLALSVDSVKQNLDPIGQDGYRAALEKLAAAQKSRAMADLQEAMKFMKQVTVDRPSFAPAWHFRGEMEAMLGNRREAAGHYDQALKCLPEFPEALCARAFLHVLDGAWTPAREKVDLALGLKPDLGEAHLLRARFQRESGENAPALESARVARRLAPLDPDLQSRAQMLASVIRGPGWARPNVHETAHYALRSDLPPAKCRGYGEHLEALRSVYEEVLGRPAAVAKRAEVLLFNAQEGYHSYMEFAGGDRHERTLGLFSSWNGQMVLFEDPETAETLAVLGHEGFHQYLHAVAPDVPIWFNEGMAEYVGATRVEKGKVVERGVIQAGRLQNLKAGIQYGWTPVPFAEIMQESQSEFYGELAPLRYAQAWSMVHYFMQGENGKWKPLLGKYIDRLVAGDGPKEAFDATFAKEDLAALEAGWSKHHSLPKPVAVAVVAVAPDPVPPGPEALPEGKPVDVLALLKGRGLPASTAWKFQDDALVLTGAAGDSVLELPFEAPEAYQLSLVVRRLGGSKSLDLGLCVGGRQVAVQIDEEGRSGLSLVNGKPHHTTPAVSPGSPPMLPLRFPSLVGCTVGRSFLTVQIHGNVGVDWREEFGPLSLPPFLTPTRPKSLFLHAGLGASFALTKFELVAVKSAGASASPKGPVAALPLAGLKTLLASKEESDRLTAIEQLGDSKDSEARTLLAEKLGTDSVGVRVAAARAIAKHRHPSVVEALDKAFQAQAKDNRVLADELIKALGALDMCASIPPLIRALKFQGGFYVYPALGQIRRIGCPEAAMKLTEVLNQLKDSMVNKGTDTARGSGLVMSIQETIRAVTTVTLPDGSTRSTYVPGDTGLKKTVSIYRCALTGETFEVPTGKAAKCPGADPAKEKHEDHFLKHRKE